MTQQARQYWLDVVYHLHLSPRAQEELTTQEWAEVVAAVDQIREDMKKD